MKSFHYWQQKLVQLLHDPPGKPFFLRAGAGGHKAVSADLFEATASRPEAKLRVYCDSQYVINSLTKWMPGWKKKGWVTASKQPVKNAELWKELDALVHGGIHRIEWHWVRGHNGHPGNERADQLANRGVPVR